MMVKNSKKGWKIYSFSLLLTFFLVFFSFSISQAAEVYPTRSINMIVPYAPASGTDLGSKIMADKIAEFLGQPLISVYKPGGGGSLGAAFAAKAKPDGYTILAGSITPFVVAPVVKKLDYTMDDFILMGIYSKNPFWIAVKSDARWKTLKDFVDEAKKTPGKLTVSTYGKLSAVDFVLELFKKQAGINVVDIPYKSSGEALTALLGGHVMLHSFQRQQVFWTPVPLGYWPLLKRNVWMGFQIYRPSKSLDTQLYWTVHIRLPSQKEHLQRWWRESSRPKRRLSRNIQKKLKPAFGK